MNAKEIVEKFKDILLSKEEPVAAEAIEVQEEVELTEQKAVAEDLAEATIEEEVAPEGAIEDAVEEDDKYATKEELAQSISRNESYV
jgi:hypothetical protein